MNNLKKLFNFTLAHFFTPWSYYLVCTGWWLATVCLCEDGQLTHVEESNRVHQEGGGQVGQVPLHPLHTRHRHIYPPSYNRCGGLVFSVPIDCPNRIRISARDLLTGRPEGRQIAP